ncbi:MAG: hypothetical protein JJT81_06280 [Rubellimicrobium sp.]|nr:hypothetical protein [Rubellimicrobium sp.]
MSEYLPEAVRKGLEDARVAMLRRSGRLCVHDGDKVHRVMRLWDGGFSLEARNAPVLRGHVDLYDGSRHIYSCLVLHSHEDEGERIYEFKWSTAVADRPAADFERSDQPPAGLIPRLF